MDKWPLVDEVEKFEKKRIAYINLRENIIVKLGESDLQRLLEICRPHLPADLGSNINDVRTLFKELEKKNRLGADHVGVLKRILNETRNEDLLKEVEEFERNRKDEDNADRERVETETKRQGETSESVEPHTPSQTGAFLQKKRVHTAIRLGSYNVTIRPSSDGVPLMCRTK